MEKFITVYMFTIGGLIFGFKATLLNLFILFFILWFVASIFDIATRLRITRVSDTSRSTKWKDGIKDRVNIGVVMLMLILVTSFISFIFDGEGTTCGIQCSAFSLMPIAFMGMFFIGEVMSILENQEEYRQISGAKPNRVTLLLTKLLGVALKKGEEFVEEKTNQITK